MLDLFDLAGVLYLDNANVHEWGQVFVIGFSLLRC